MSLGAAVDSIEAAVDGGGTGAAAAVTGQADGEGDGDAWQASPDDLMAVWNYSRCVGETQAAFTVKTVISYGLTNHFAKSGLGQTSERLTTQRNGDCHRRIAITLDSLMLGPLVVAVWAGFAIHNIMPMVMHYRLRWVLSKRWVDKRNTQSETIEASVSSSPFSQFLAMRFNE